MVCFWHRCMKLPPMRMFCGVMMTATYESRSLLSSSVRCATARPNVDVLILAVLSLKLSYERVRASLLWQAAAVPLLSALTGDVIHRWRECALIS